MTVAPLDGIATRCARRPSGGTAFDGRDQRDLPSASIRRQVSGLGGDGLRHHVDGTTLSIPQGLFSLVWKVARGAPDRSTTVYSSNV